MVTEEKSTVVKCTDKNCAKHRNLAARGFKLEGTIVSDRMKKSVVVEIPFVKKIQKYQRYERSKSRVTAHNPACIGAKYGDKVVIQQCKPISKTKSFVVISKKE